MNRRLLLILLMVCCSSAVAQNRKSARSLSKPKGKQAGTFLNKQWWLGFKAGTNFTQASVIKRYSIVTPTNYSPGLTNKTYDGFKTLGSQAGVEISFQYNHFLFSTQPAYRQSIYSYSTNFHWTNLEDASQSLSQTYNQQQKINYIDLPFLIKYTIGEKKFRPYVNVGIYYSYLINATQTVMMSGVDQASGGTNQFTSSPVIVGAKDMFANYWSIAFGAGVTYQLGNFQLVLDGSYRKGMSNITNVHNRYSNDRLSGIGDVQDDVKINNIVISAGVLFPMRFLNRNFKAVDRQ